MRIDARVEVREYMPQGSELRRKLSQAVRAAAFGVERDAKINAPVDTGYLRGSIYTVTHRSSGHDAAFKRTERTRARTNKRRAKSGQQQQYIAFNFDDGSGESIDSDLEAAVVVGAEYGAHVEYGTGNAPAQPFLTPAADDGMANLEEAVAAILRKIGRRG